MDMIEKVRETDATTIPGGTPWNGPVCLIISNIEAIGVDIRRQVTYHLIITEKKLVHGKRAKENRLCSSLPLMSIIKFLISIQRGVFKLSYSRRKLWYGWRGYDDRSHHLSPSSLEARQEPHAPNICLQLRVQKEWKKWIASYLSFLSRMQKGIEWMSVFKLCPLPLHDKEKRTQVKEWLAVYNSQSNLRNSIKLIRMID